MQKKYTNVHKYYIVKYGNVKGKEMFRKYMLRKKQPPATKPSTPVPFPVGKKQRFKLKSIYPIHHSVHTRIVSKHSSQNLLQFVSAK